LGARCEDFDCCATENDAAHGYPNGNEDLWNVVSDEMSKAGLRVSELAIQPNGVQVERWVG
jgi:hypothetical protein